MAGAAGAKTVSGLKMLLYQGVDAFELWNSDLDVKISKEQADEVYKSLVMEVTGATNIILEGFMGCGKTTVSEILADKLGIELIDTDEVIVDTEKRSVNDIFANEGEQYFRDLETELLRTIVEDHWRETVISLGGGLPLREENRELLRRAGKVVYLRTSPETVFARIKDDTTRPLLQAGDSLVRIKELQDERREIYEQAADIIIDTDDLTPEAIACEIVRQLGL
jgi:shikimate dehydrogenase